MSTNRYVDKQNVICPYKTGYTALDALQPLIQ